MKKIFLIFIFFLCWALGVFVSAHKSNSPQIFKDICQLIEEKYFDPNPQFQKWLGECYELSQKSQDLKKDQLVQAIKDHLAQLKVSHLQLQTPAQYNEAWNAEAEYTGIKARFIESELLVYDVLENSPAQAAGINIGDAVVSLNQEQPSSWAVEKTAGEYVLESRGKLKTVQLKTKVLQLKQDPSLSRINSDWALLKLPSFRVEVFKSYDLPNLLRGFKNYKNILVDLRGNSGGNFVAMLRVLSKFYCQPYLLGTLKQSPIKKLATEQLELPNELSDMDQLAVLDQARRIDLKTYPEAECFKGKVSVLIDQDSSSTAEIFADAIQASKRGKVLGTPSSGQVLLSVWYPILSLGPNYVLTVPEAQYVDCIGQSLESKGVEPNRILYYDLSLEKKGQDSWLMRAVSF